MNINTDYIEDFNDFGWDENFFSAVFIKNIQTKTKQAVTHLIESLKTDQTPLAFQKACCGLAHIPAEKQKYIEKLSQAIQNRFTKKTDAQQNVLQEEEKKQLLSLQRALWQAIHNKNTSAALTALSHLPCIHPLPLQENPVNFLKLAINTLPDPKLIQELLKKETFPYQKKLADLLKDTQNQEEVLNLLQVCMKGYDWEEEMFDALLRYDAKTRRSLCESAQALMSEETSYDSLRRDLLPELLKLPAEERLITCQAVRPLLNQQALSDAIPYFIFLQNIPLNKRIPLCEAAALLIHPEDSIPAKQNIFQHLAQIDSRSQNELAQAIAQTPYRSQAPFLLSIFQNYPIQSGIFCCRLFQQASERLAQQLLDRYQLLFLLDYMPKTFDEKTDEIDETISLILSFLNPVDTVQNLNNLAITALNIPFEERKMIFTIALHTASNTSFLLKTMCIQSISALPTSILKDLSDLLLLFSQSHYSPAEKKSISHLIFKIVPSERRSLLQTAKYFVEDQATFHDRKKILEILTSIPLEKRQHLPEQAAQLENELRGGYNKFEILCGCLLLPQEKTTEHVELFRILMRSNTFAIEACKTLVSFSAEVFDSIVLNPYYSMIKPGIHVLYGPEVIQLAHQMIQQNEMTQQLSTEKLNEELYKSAPIKQAIADRLNRLLNENPNPQFHMHLANVFFNCAHRFGFSVEDEIFYRFVSTLYLADPEVRDNPQNPYRLFYELKKILSEELYVTYSAPVEEIHLFAQQNKRTRKAVQWNIDALRAANSWEGYKALHLQQIQAACEETINKNALLSLFSQLEERLKDKWEIVENQIQQQFGLSYGQLKEGISKEEVYQWLTPATSKEPEAPVEESRGQLYSIMSYILAGKTTISEDSLFSEREMRLLGLCGSIRNCGIGLSYGIVNYHNHVVPLQYKVSKHNSPSAGAAAYTESVYYDLLQTVLMDTFGSVEFVKAFVGEDSLDQLSHFATYLKNRYAKQAGLKHQLRFDFSTGILNPKLLDVPVEKALKELFKIFTPSKVLDRLVKNTELFTDKRFYPGFVELVCKAENITEDTFNKRTYQEQINERILYKEDENGQRVPYRRITPYLIFEEDDFGDLHKPVGLTSLGAFCLMKSQNTLKYASE